MKGPKLVPLSLLVVISSHLFAEDVRILPLGDYRYLEVEEISISSMRIPPRFATPVVAAELERRSASVPGYPEPRSGKNREGTAPAPVSLFADLGFSFATMNDPNLGSAISTKKYIANPVGPGSWVPGGQQFLDYSSLYELEQLPSLLSVGIQAQSEHFAILFNPVLRASMLELLTEYNGTNFPSNPVRFDVNFPYRGYAGYWSDELELRIARDKLNLGPGRWSTLTLNKNVPYFDYVKAALHFPKLEVSAYYVRLNPILSPDESDYLDAIYDGPEPNLEPNTGMEKLNREKSKSLTVGRLTWEPAPWLTIAVTQNILLGGRAPQLTELNPFIVFHNLFEDGLYGVPATVAFGLVPIKGVYLYGEWLLYDLTVADEVGNLTSPGAGAYQAGLTLLSNPYFSLGPGRFRLDSEWTYASPWVYNKYTSYRKFTTRFVYVEPFDGRPWVDFPLGFYRGPDCWELNTLLSYGKPGSWDVSLHWQLTEKGEIDLYGFGQDSDYAHIESFPINGLLSGTPAITNVLRLGAYWYPVPKLRIDAWAQYVTVQNAGHVPGAFQSWPDFGMKAVWSIY